MPKKIPEGFHTITPYLTMKDTAAAIEYYKKALNAKEDSLMRGPDGKVMHACITIGNSKIFLSDENPNMGCPAANSSEGSSINFYLYVEDADAAYKQAIAAGMTEIMPVDDMFWGDRMGAARDKFGYKWNFATQVKELSKDEVAKAAEKFFSQKAA